MSSSSSSSSSMDDPYGPVYTDGRDPNHDNYTDHYSIYYDFYQDCGVASIPAFSEYRVAEMITTVLYPVLIVLGLVGNGVSVVVLRHLSVNVWSTCLYMAVLSAVELVVLIIRSGGTWFLEVVGLNPSRKVMNWSDAMCKTYLFVLNVLLQMWPWLMVALSVDLVISTRYPLKTYRMCTTERARATVLLITILLVCLNLNFFWTWGLVMGHECMYIDPFSREFLNIIWPSIETTVKHILPLIAVTIAFFLSVISLLRSRRSGAPSYEPILRRYFMDLQALQQLKHVALVIALLFIIVKTFTFVVELLNALESRNVIVVPCEQYAQFRARFKLVQTLRDTVVYSFHSLKFFMYFTMCSSFRQKVFSIARKMFFCGKAQGDRRKSRVVKDKNNKQIEQTDHTGQEGNSRMNSTGLQDLNGHHPTVFSKTTHV
ncbi:uncharacterized protein LOC143300512 isoform X2 [Babylonia areolata]